MFGAGEFNGVGLLIVLLAVHVRTRAATVGVAD